MDRKLWRWFLGALSLLNVFILIFALVYLWRPSALGASIQAFINASNFWQKSLIFILLLLLLASALFIFFYAILGGRFKARKTATNEIGDIKIGATAIEHVALNAARTAQAGIKTAKASVFNTDNQDIRIELDVVLYSDVEIPQQMRRIQERVKKDVEKYTGFSVAEVVINVKRVELIGAVVER